MQYQNFYIIVIESYTNYMWYDMFF